MSCACQTPPPEQSRRRRLVLSIRFPHTRRKVTRALEQLGGELQSRADIVTASFDGAAFGSALEGLMKSISTAEADAIRAVVIDAESEPSINDYLQSDSLTRLAAQVRSRWLIDALESCDRVSHFQPIFDARTNQIYAHEALLRVRHNGEIVGPGEAFAAASDGDLAQYLDRVARETAIESAAKAGIATNLFINFLPSAIYDPTTCLATTILALDRHAVAHERVVFEVVESERIYDPAHLRAIADFYREAGFRIALDDLGAGYSSFTLVHQLHPDFVKLDMTLVQNVDNDSYKAVLAARLIDAAHELGIAVVAEGIEREGELDWVRRHGVEYAQGYFLGRPSPNAATAA